MEYLTTYREMKQSLIDQLEINDATAHIHTGLMIYVFVAFIMRKRLHSHSALGAVFSCAIINEVVDWTAGRPSSDVIADVVNTCFWPLAIFTLARLRHERVLNVSRRHQQLQRKLLELEPSGSMVTSEAVFRNSGREGMKPSPEAIAAEHGTAECVNGLLAPDCGSAVPA